jgi:hypothetical protein
MRLSTGRLELEGHAQAPILMVLIACVTALPLARINTTPPGAKNVFKV